MITDWKNDIVEDYTYLNIFISCNLVQTGVEEKLKCRSEEQYLHKVALHLHTYTN